MRPGSCAVLLSLALGLAASPATTQEQPQPTQNQQPPAPPEVPLLFECDPAKAWIEVDGHQVCDQTPCSHRVAPGEHVITMDAPYHERRSEHLQVTAGTTLRWTLTRRPYSYFGMNDVTEGLYPITIGLSPEGSSYRKITALDSTHFKRLHPILDAGYGFEMFSYHTSSHGSSWGVMAFGPAVRLGRLVLQLDFNLISFRHKSANDSTGWLPGLNFRALLPLATQRDVGDVAFLFPALVAGVDVWYDDSLDHDHTRAWVGISWLGDFDFFASVRRR